jgi:FKBP-type peptidyl-prolyl cis-trans isomerase SlyD
MNTKVLSFHFTAYNEDGSINDTSIGNEPVNILTGFGHVLPILENTLKNMEVGSKKTVLVTPSEGFGEVDKNKIQEFPKNVFNGNNFELGMIVNLVSPEGYRIFGIIDNVTDNTVVINFNHPLAGKTLKFDLDLLSVRDASKEEIEHGHVHDGLNKH